MQLMTPEASQRTYYYLAVSKRSSSSFLSLFFLALVLLLLSINLQSSAAQQKQCGDPLQELYYQPRGWYLCTNLNINPTFRRKTCRWWVCLLDVYEISINPGYNFKCSRKQRYKPLTAKVCISSILSTRDFCGFFCHSRNDVVIFVSLWYKESSPLKV